jgi:hypothetical protein
MSIRKTASGGQVTGVEPLPEGIVLGPDDKVRFTGPVPFVRTGGHEAAGWDEDDEAGLRTESDRD